MRLIHVFALCLLIGIFSFAQATMISVEPASAFQRTGHNPLDSDACPPGVITSIPVTITGNTSFSTHNYDLSCVASTAGDDIYSLFLTCRALVTVSLCGSGYDTALEARLGPENIDCPGTLVEACNDDHCGTQSQISFTVDPAQYSYIIVSGYHTATGPYTMSITGTLLPPLNDHCDGPIPVSSLPYTVVNSTACATQGEDPSCAFSSAPDVVYELLMPCDMDVTATTCGFNGYDVVLYVRTGGSCPGNEEIACNDDACANNQSTVNFHLLGGFPYFIWVDGYLNSSGLYSLSITETHPVYGCPNSIILPDTFQYAVGGRSDCNGVTGLPTCVPSTAPQIVYTYTPATCRTVGLNTCGSFFNTALQVRTGGSCPGSTLVACNSGYCGTGSRLLFDASAGQTYYVLVGGNGNVSGLYFLDMITTPCSPPHPVTDLVVNLDPDYGIFLYWTPLPWADRYNIYADTTLDFPLDSAHWITWAGGNSVYLYLPGDVPFTKVYYNVTWATTAQQSLDALPSAVAPVRTSVPSAAGIAGSSRQRKS